MRSETADGRHVLDPEPRWTVVTDAPFKGLALAREAGQILAWDEAGTLYLINAAGETIARRRAPSSVLSAAISDDGSSAAALVEDRRLWLLGNRLEPTSERGTINEATTIAVDALGRYIAVSSKAKQIQIYTHHGQPVGRTELLQPVLHLVFVPSKPVLLVGGAFGLLAALELTRRGGENKLAIELLWKETLVSSIGSLACTGDSSMILTSCYTHGVQRFNAEGQNEGSYHLGGSTSHAIPDFSGRKIAVATVEGELAILNRAGNVRWKTGLPRPVSALAIDPLGRYLIHANSAGEITRVDLEETSRSAADGSAVRPAQPHAIAMGGSHSTPSASLGDAAWRVPIAKSDDEALTLVIAVLDEPPRIAVASRDNRLRVFDRQGKSTAVVPEILGAGRFLRTEPGWIAIGTDRQVALHDARHNTSQRVELSLVEVTHLELGLEHFGLGIIQERDRLGRATIAGRWIWKRELNSPVEEAAIGPGGTFAVTTEDGNLLILDAAGEPMGTYRSDPQEPLSLIAAPEGAPAGVVWLSLARHLQVLRGHGLNGKVVWEAPIPWESWKLQRLDDCALVASPDGRALAFNGSGEPQARGKPIEDPVQYGRSESGTILRVQTRESQCLCTDLDGHALWRSLCDAPLGPFSVSSTGVAAIVGRDLAWFPHPPGLLKHSAAAEVEIQWDDHP